MEHFEGSERIKTPDVTRRALMLALPIDLYNGGTGPAVNGPSFTVSLPAYGFAMLQVSTS
jgi:hypothetical protein